MDHAILKERLCKALRTGGGLYAYEDIVDALEAGQMQAFWSDDAIVVTQIQEFPRAKYLHVAFAAGTWQACLALQDDYVRFAREHGCKAVTAAGRKGWLKILPRYGWKAENYVGYLLPTTEGGEDEQAIRVTEAA